MRNLVFTRSIMEEGEEFGTLNIDSPSSHVALSGDLTVIIVKSDPILKGVKHTNELKENSANVEHLENFSNELPLLR